MTETNLIGEPTYLTPRQFTELLGKAIVTERQIRRLCEDGMDGARKIGKRWKIDPLLAIRWLRDSEHAPIVANRLPITMQDDGSVADIQPNTKIDLPADHALQVDQVSALERHIDDLGLISATMLQLLAGGTYEPRAGQMVKSLLSEIRAAETHVLEMRKADARLMERERHRFILKNVATLFRMELESMRSAIPDALLAAITEAGLVIGRVDDAGAFADEAAKAVRCFTMVAGDAIRDQLNRLADTIERSQLDEMTTTG